MAEQHPRPTPVPTSTQHRPPASPRLTKLDADDAVPQLGSLASDGPARPQRPMAAPLRRARPSTPSPWSAAWLHGQHRPARARAGRGSGCGISAYQLVRKAQGKGQQQPTSLTVYGVTCRLGDAKIEHVFRRDRLRRVPQRHISAPPRATVADATMYTDQTDRPPSTTCACTIKAPFQQEHPRSAQITAGTGKPTSKSSSKIPGSAERRSLDGLPGRRRGDCCLSAPCARGAYYDHWHPAVRGVWTATCLRTRRQQRAWTPAAAPLPATWVTAASDLGALLLSAEAPRHRPRSG